MNKISLKLLGKFRLEVQGKEIEHFRTLKVQALLVYLAAEPPGEHRREALMTLLWPGMPEFSARSNLRQVLFLLRQMFPETEIEGEPDLLFIANRSAIRLNPAVDLSVDIHTFEQLLDATAHHEHVDLLTCRICQENLGNAAALYQGDFLPDLYLDDSNAFEDWAESTRQRLRRKALDVLETLANIAIRQKDFIRARGFTERQLEIDNLRETAYQQLMEILARSGRRSEALAVYERGRTLFAEELGMAPAARSTALYERIRDGALEIDPFSMEAVRGYQLKEEIGSGAYGVIHRAIQPSIGRDVAIKVIGRRFANDPDFIRRFEIEAQTIARLEHPHIVPLYDYWRESDGAFLVMRLLRGGSLLEALANGPWTAVRTAELLEQIAPALHVAHQHGIVHRDIKPANILFDETGNAYLSDFGIARDLTAEQRLTGPGEAFGTPDYSSPEQLLDQPVSPQSDIYSLGAVLFEILTGERPFGNRPLASLIESHIKASFPLLRETRPGLPLPLDDVLQRATAKQPENRFGDVLEMAAAFQAALSGAAAATVDHLQVARNPYKGLRAFQETDAGTFFGREALIRRLLARLENQRFLAVIGPSGSGKSSAVRAGLLPALRAGALPGSAEWFFAEMTPGAHPLEALEMALWPVAVNPPAGMVETMERDVRGMLRTIRRVLPDPAGSRLLLFIDQFEELFTQVTDPARRDHFLDSLVTAVTDPHTPLCLVATLRADFYDRPLQHPGIAAFFERHTEVVLPLNRDEQITAIREPARLAGVEFEEGLTAEILADVHAQPGSLPLLQYALTELFDRRTGNTLTRRVYREIGGVPGALARRAEEAVTTSPSDHLEIIQQVFLRLVTPGEGIEDTRRRVPLPELLQIAGGDHTIVQDILDRFGEARLLTFDADPATRTPTVEVAHEALLQQWGRFRGWIDARRQDIRLQRGLAQAAADWDTQGRNPGYLLRGPRLAVYEDWQSHPPIFLNPLEAEFLQTAFTHSQAEAEAEIDRTRRELDTARALAKSERARAEEQLAASSRLRRRAWGLAGALALAVVLAGFALFSRRQSLQSRADLQSLALASGAQVAGKNGDVDLALSLALAANQGGAPPVSSQSLLYDIALGAGTIRQIQAGEGWRWVLAVHPTETWVAADQGLGDIVVWDYATGREILHIPAAHAEPVGGLAFTPDGQALLSGAFDDRLVLWDLSSGEAIWEAENPSGDVNGLAISPDGRIAAAGTEFGSATLWDLASGEMLGELVHNPELQVLPVVFSPDGAVLATGSEDGSVATWDPDTRTRLQHIQVIDDVVFGLAISPEGILAAAGKSDTIHLFDIHSGAALVQLGGHPEWIFHLDFNADGSELLAAVRDGALVRWDLASGQRTGTWYGEEGFTLSAFFLEDGMALTGSTTGNIRVWQLDGDRAADALSAGEFLASFALTADQGLAALGLQGRVLLVETGSKQVRLALPMDGAFVTAVAFSPDGARLAAAVQTGTPLDRGSGLVLWDTESGRELHRLTGHTDYIYGLAFSPDGARLLSAGDDKQVILWNLETGLQIASHTNPDDTFNTVAFSPDGRLYAAGAGTLHFPAGGNFVDNSIYLWDAETGEQVARLEGHTDAVVRIIFSADSRRLLSGSMDTTVGLWDVAGGVLLAKLNGHTGGVFGVGFSRDEAFAVSSAQDGTLIVWDLTAGEALRELRGHAGAVHWAGFSPDGDRLLSAGEDGRLLWWDPLLDLAELLDWAGAHRFLAPLPCDQQLKYGLVEVCSSD